MEISNKSSKLLTSNQQLLIEKLADSDWHSGQVLAETLGVSRTAIWKSLSDLNRVGLNILSHKKKGYKLDRSLELLDLSLLENHLNDFSKEFYSDLDYIMSLGSTNYYASQFGSSGYVCLTEMQTKGQGRRGRSWKTPFASQITMSLVHKFSEGMSHISGLSLAVGVAVIRAFYTFDIKGVTLKWPNDIMFDNKKLGGVLLEVSGDVLGPCEVIIGLGLNVDPGGLGKDYPTWASVYDIPFSKECSRTLLTAAILNELASILSDYALLGFSYYKNEWMKYDAYFNQTIKIINNDREWIGCENGVDDIGCLEVLIDGETQVFSGGEVSLRRVDGENY
jgi:BirA family transcriptional regulator, biotin operon repressor / biotin---[acetyl-CoA-carboxylase] ligase